MPDPRLLSTETAYAGRLFNVSLDTIEMDGGVIAGKIQASPDCRNVSLIFLTAAVKKEEIEACGGFIGGFPYVPKPLNIKGVIGVIEQQLAGRKLG